MSSPYFDNIPGLKRHYSLGRRGWGLVLYGALPASLVCLGVIKVQVPALTLSEADLLNITIASLPLIAIAGIPLTISFLLVRQRMAAWYLLADRLTSRTILVWAAIAVCSTIVTWGALYVKAKQGQGPGYIEIALTTVAILVGSSTLFLTAVKEVGGLPALPSKQFVGHVTSLQGLLLKIQDDPIWKTVERPQEDTLKQDIEKATRTCQSLKSRFAQTSPHYELYGALESDLSKMETARSKSKTEPKRKKYFGDEAPQGMEGGDEEDRQAVQRLGRLRLSSKLI